MEYICEVLPLKKRECINGYTHRAQVFRLNGTSSHTCEGPQRIVSRTLILSQLGSSAENARHNLFLFGHRVSVRDKELVVAAIEAAGKETTA